MKIVFMDGGLGNQVFQYIFYRFLQEHCQEPVYIDDRFFHYSNALNGYELHNVFGLKPNLLSEYFSADVWDEIMDVSQNQMHFVELLNRNGFEIPVISEGNFITFHHSAYIGHPDIKTQAYTGSYLPVAANGYHPQIAEVPGSIYYHGYWINGHYFAKIRDKILQELTFPAFENDHNKEYVAKIQGSLSVGIHVRRGDFVDYGYVLDADFYRMSVTAMKEVLKKPTFFLFSDDLPWCKENLDKLGLNKSDKTVFVEGNTSKNSFRDMQLMTLFKYFISANSSFSYLASLLNKNPDKVIADPTTRAII